MASHPEPPSISGSGPLGLRDVLNGPSNRHDSAYFSTPSESSSKRMENETPQSSPSPHTTGWLTVTAPDNSSTSFGPNNGYAPPQSRDKATPSPTSGHLAPQSVISPATTSMSVASIVSPSPSSLNGNRYSQASYDSHRGSALMDTDEHRDSVDSRMNQGFGDMRLNNSASVPPSPYTNSMHYNSAAQQRIPPRSRVETLSHRLSNSYSPAAERNPVDPRIDNRASRVAPTITGPTQGIIARAAEPTKGQAWAFPEDENRTSTAAGSYTESRRSSLADSINSSQFTTESRLPPGQLRLEAQSIDGHRLSNTSHEYLPMHHHSIQHKKISDLQEEGRPAGSQPYSRTPELRQSHKLAERKRRTEMKELFEQLRELMPQERGAKASKWEILTKAITEIKRLNDNIRNMSIHYNGAVNEIEVHRREIHGLRLENAELRAKLNSLSIAPGASHPPHSTHHSPHGPPHPSSLPPPGSVPPQTGSHYGGSDYNSVSRSEPRPELPPLRAISGGLPPPHNPDSMTGVTYDNHRPPY